MLVPCAGAVVRDAAGRLLLIRRANPPHEGAWSLPGGRLEPGETHAQAATREVLEETGLRVRVGRRLVTVRIGDYEVEDFAAEVIDGELRAGDDAREAAWFTPAEVAGLDTSPGLVEALRGVGVL